MPEWEKFEKNDAKSIYSRNFDWPDIAYRDFDKIKEFKVKPGGVFLDHVDKYHHLIIVESGEGVFRLDEEEYQMKNVIAVKAGEMHGYRNDSNKDLMLIVCNTKSIIFDE